MRPVSPCVARRDCAKRRSSQRRAGKPGKHPGSSAGPASPKRVHDGCGIQQHERDRAVEHDRERTGHPQPWRQDLVRAAPRKAPKRAANCEQRLQTGEPEQDRGSGKRKGASHEQDTSGRTRPRPSGVSRALATCITAGTPRGFLLLSPVAYVAAGTRRAGLAKRAVVLPCEAANR
jgi:hypothetical protein